MLHDFHPSLLSCVDKKDNNSPCPITCIVPNITSHFILHNYSVPSGADVIHVHPNDPVGKDKLKLLAQCTKLAVRNVKPHICW